MLEDAVPTLITAVAGRRCSTAQYVVYRITMNTQLNCSTLAEFLPISHQRRRLWLGEQHCDTNGGGKKGNAVVIKGGSSTGVQTPDYKGKAHP